MQNRIILHFGCLPSIISYMGTAEDNRDWILRNKDCGREIVLKGGYYRIYLGDEELVIVIHDYATMIEYAAYYRGDNPLFAVVLTTHVNINAFMGYVLRPSLIAIPMNIVCKKANETHFNYVTIITGARLREVSFCKLCALSRVEQPKHICEQCTSRYNLCVQTYISAYYALRELLVDLRDTIFMAMLEL